jgi:hypothetical protein
MLPALRQLLCVLVAVHSKDIVHGDLKLANALVATDGTVVLSDFEIARVDALTAVLALAGRTTRFGAGTPLFMAPEVAAGGRATAASDVFGFAVCALAALAPGCPLQPPPRGHADAAAALKAADPAAAAALAAALAKDPAARPTAAALLALPLFALDSAAAAALAAREAAATARQRSCVVCLVSCDTAIDGCLCAREHFVCTSCLVRQVAEPDAPRRLAADGGVRCPGLPCDSSPLDMGALARALPEEVLAKVRRLTDKAAVALPETWTEKVRTNSCVLVMYSSKRDSLDAEFDRARTAATARRPGGLRCAASWP